MNIPDYLDYYIGWLNDHEYDLFLNYESIYMNPGFYGYSKNTYRNEFILKCTEYLNKDEYVLLNVYLLTFN